MHGMTVPWATLGHSFRMGMFTPVVIRARAGCAALYVVDVYSR